MYLVSRLLKILKLNIKKSSIRKWTWMLGAGALGRPRGMIWGGRREVGSGWGTQVYLWWIHFDMWQNQYNIVKLKNKIKKNNKLNPSHNTSGKKKKKENGQKTVRGISLKRVCDGKKAHGKMFNITSYQGDAGLGTIRVDFLRGPVVENLPPNVQDMGSITDPGELHMPWDN